MKSALKTLSDYLQGESTERICELYAFAEDHIAPLYLSYLEDFRYEEFKRIELARIDELN